MQRKVGGWQRVKEERIQGGDGAVPRPNGAKPRYHTSWLSPLRSPAAATAVPKEFFQFSLPACASNRASPENTCGIRTLLPRNPDCRTRRSPALQPPVNVPADLDRVALPIVPEAPCRSSPDRFDACSLRKPSSPPAHLWRVELQNQHAPEQRKWPRGQTVRPPLEE